MNAEAITLVTQLINNNLFPIAICLILMWYIKGVQEKERESIEAMSKVIAENTTVMRELQTRYQEVKDIKGGTRT